MQAFLPASSSAPRRQSMLGLAPLNTIYQFLFCAILSSALTALPLLGCALFLCGQVSLMLWRLLLGEERRLLGRVARRTCLFLTAALFLIVGLSIALYPMSLDSASLWALTSAVATMFLREKLCRKLARRRLRGTVGLPAFWGMLICVQLSCAGLTAWPLFLALPTKSALGMLGGYLLGAALDGYAHWRAREELAMELPWDGATREEIEATAGALQKVSAYASYQRIYTLVLVALQTTLVLVYTFIGLTTDELFVCLLLAAASTTLVRELANAALRRLKPGGSVQALTIGLFLWMCGLFLFYREMKETPNLIVSYMELCLSCGGLSLCVTALTELEGRMIDVAQFGLEKETTGYFQLRLLNTEMALLLGQTLALGVLTFLCSSQVFPPVLDGAALLQAVHRWMLAPPMLLLAAAILCVLRFPMNNRYFAKLAKWLTLKEEGGDNPPLQKQLENVVIRRHKNRFGVKLIITLLRPLYYHQVAGRENLQGYEDGSMVLVCNHGELYGPVVANLYVPVSFRPWVIAEMMDRDVVIEHMYQGTMMRQKWLPERWKRPLLRLVAPLLFWVFNSLEAIPVYRGKPRELIRTFRETIDAMQSGDNILLFPENDTGHAPGERGYTLEGVGRLFTGFAMIAPLYYAKTGKRAVFIPIYASKKTRVVQIGEGIVYQPEAPAGEEKQRIVQGLLDQMQRLYEKEKE